MKYSHYWDVTQVQDLIRTESRQKTKAHFLQTHLPFSNIRVDFCKERYHGSRMIDEEMFAQIVQGGKVQEHNRLFFVVGEAGCGKSELCQWMEYQADITRTLPIHIPRSETTARQVAARLRQHLTTFIPQLIPHHAPPALEARFVAITANMLIFEQSSPLQNTPAVAETFWESKPLLQALTNWFTTPDTSARFVLQPEWLDACLEHYHSTPEPDILLVERIINDAIEKRIWLTDVRTLLSTCADQCVAQGRRPLLLIEDITAFQSLGDILFDYLLDLSSGHFDAVIGMTTGFEQTQLQKVSLIQDMTHIHHRLRGRFFLTDALGHSYDLEAQLVPFVQKYMQALYQFQEATDPRPIESIKPFTETMLHRAYTALHEEGNPRKTPRLFLEQVIVPMLMSPTISISALDNSPFLETPPLLFPPDAVNDPVLTSILRWYGEVQTDCVTLDPCILQWWDIPIPVSLLHNGVIRVKRTMKAMNRQVSLQQSDQWEQALREFQYWIDHGGIYPNRETLKRGIERVIMNIGDPRVLTLGAVSVSHAAYVYYARGDERLPINLDGESGDSVGKETPIVIEISRLMDERNILEELVYLSLSNGDLAVICRNSVHTLEWGRQKHDAFRGHARNVLQRLLGGIALEELIFVAWKLLAALQGDTWQHVRQHEQTTSPDLWDALQYPNLHESGKVLLLWHESFRQLFIGQFMLRETMFDCDTLQPLLEREDWGDVLAVLAAFPVHQLKTKPFKVRPSGISLYNLLVPLQAYIRRLCQLDTRTSLTRDMTQISAAIITLKMHIEFNHVAFEKATHALKVYCVQLGMHWNELWDEHARILKSFAPNDHSHLLQSLQQALDRGHTLMHTSIDIWEYMVFRLELYPYLQHPFLEAHQGLKTMQEQVIKAIRLYYRKSSKLVTGKRSYQRLVQYSQRIHEEFYDDRNSD